MTWPLTTAIACASERPGSFVEVVYDASRPHEVAIWLGPPSSDREPPLELADALRASSCADEDVRFVELIQTSDVEALSRVLGRVAQLLRDCAGQLLEGDTEALAAARALRSERAASYTSALRNAGVFEAADEAWAEKDFGRVHDLLNPIRDALDGSRRRRLEFAEKRLP